MHAISSWRTAPLTPLEQKHTELLCRWFDLASRARRNPLLVPHLRELEAKLETVEAALAQHQEGQHGDVV